MIAGVRGELDKTETSVKSSGKTMGDYGNAMKGVATAAAGFAVAQVGFQGVATVTGFLNDSIDAARESKQAMAQLDAVIKSTGGAAGVSAKEVAELASSLERHSVFEDEAILKGQNLLLTFTNIKNGVGENNQIFDDATKIMVDMAQAMGTDVSSGAIQLGKALNDPVAGISALSRVGVTFTEDQKEMIKAMVEAGDTAGAQQVILAELNKEFGGSAQAASDAAGAQEKYKDKMNDLKEQIGEQMLPIQEKWLELQAAVVTVIAEQVIPTIENFVKYIQMVLENGDTLNDYLANLPEPLQGVAKAFGEVVLVVKEHWPEIMAVVQFVYEYVKTQIEGMIQMINGIVDVVTGVVALVSALAHGDWAAAWDAFVQILNGFLDIIEGNIKRIFGNIPQIILGLMGEIAGAAYQLGKNLADSVINGIGNLASRVAEKVSILGVSGKDVINAAGDAAGWITGRAGGGPASGLTWVGERGPELLQLPTGSYVYNSQTSRGMAGGDGGVNVYIDTVLATNAAEAKRAGNDIGWALALRGA